MFVEVHIKRSQLPATVSAVSLGNFFSYMVHQQFLESQTFSLPVYHHQSSSWVFFVLPITTSGFCGLPSTVIILKRYWLTKSHTLHRFWMTRSLPLSWQVVFGLPQTLNNHNYLGLHPSTFLLGTRISIQFQPYVKSWRQWQLENKSAIRQFWTIENCIYIKKKWIPCTYQQLITSWCKSSSSPKNPS